MTLINKATLNNDKLLIEYYKKQQPQLSHKKLLMKYCENKQ